MTVRLFVACPRLHSTRQHVGTSHLLMCKSWVLTHAALVHKMTELVKAEVVALPPRRLDQHVQPEGEHQRFQLLLHRLLQVGPLPLGAFGGRELPDLSIDVVQRAIQRVPLHGQRLPRPPRRDLHLRHLKSLDARELRPIRCHTTHADGAHAQQVPARGHAGMGMCN